MEILVLIKPIHQKILEKANPFLRTQKNLIDTRIALYYALNLLKSEKGDEDVVIPAVLLHDVGWKTIPANLHLTAFGPNFLFKLLLASHLFSEYTSSENRRR